MDPIPASEPQRPWTTVAIWIVEVVLILAIIGLLIAVWLPAWIGGRPGLPRVQ